MRLSDICYMCVNWLDTPLLTLVHRMCTVGAPPVHSNSSESVQEMAPLKRVALITERLLWRYWLVLSVVKGPPH